MRPHGPDASVAADPAAGHWASCRGNQSEITYSVPVNSSAMKVDIMDSNIGWFGFDEATISSVNLPPTIFSASFAALTANGNAAL